MSERRKARPSLRLQALSSRYNQCYLRGQREGQGQLLTHWRSVQYPPWGCFFAGDRNKPSPQSMSTRRGAARTGPTDERGRPHCSLLGSQQQLEAPRGAGCASPSQSLSPATWWQTWFLAPSQHQPGSGAKAPLALQRVWRWRHSL